jgi:hypothetical protein
VALALVLPSSSVTISKAPIYNMCGVVCCVCVCVCGRWLQQRPVVAGAEALQREVARC